MRLQILILLKIQKLKQGNILAKKFVFIIGKYSKLWNVVLVEKQNVLIVFACNC